jgi:DNA-binding GntR family transcriptional regulator
VEVAEALRARVESGELAPGERLPKLRDLAVDYHVSVGTVVRALGMLKHGGILVTGQGRGSFVRGPESRPERGAMIPRPVLTSEVL